MDNPEDPALARAALAAAAHLELRPFLLAALEGALALIEAEAGGILLAKEGRAGEAADSVDVTGADAADERGEGEVDEGILVTAPLGRPGLKRFFSLHDLRLIDSIVPDGGERITGTWIESRTEVPPPDEILAVPLDAEGRRAGLLVLVPMGSGAGFAPGDLERCRGYASLLSPLLENALRVRELQDTVVRDDMADCYNRRYLDEFLAQETARARRFRKPLALIFLDMDDLKSVNSAHGHSAGSDALREVARRINGVTRRIDKVFRFGGDEFCIVLPETDLTGARRVAERVRAAIAGGPMLTGEIPGGVTLTASVGIATFPVHASTGDAMLAAADAAMRRIKQEGKNAISVADPCFPWEEASHPEDAS